MPVIPINKSMQGLRPGLRRPRIEISEDFKHKAFLLFTGRLGASKIVLAEIFNILSPLESSLRRKMTLEAMGWVLFQEAQFCAIVISSEDGRFRESFMVDIKPDSVLVRTLSSGPSSDQPADWRTQPNPYLAFARLVLSEQTPPNLAPRREFLADGSREVVAFPCVVDGNLRAVAVAVSRPGEQISETAEENFSNFINGIGAGEKPFEGVKFFL